MAGFSGNVSGADVVYAKNIDFSGSNSIGNTITTNGQFPIGTTALNAGGTHINIGTITSPLGTLSIGYSSPNITLDLAGGLSAIEKITGDSGFVSGNNVTIFANQATSNSGKTVKFTNSGTVSTLNVTDSNQNTLIGLSSGLNLTSGTTNTSLGYTSLGALTTGNINVGLGDNALRNLTTGSYNTAVGSGAGTNYTGSESSNITIKHTGIIADSNTIRIGTQGSSSGQQNKCFVAGITGIIPGGTTPQVVLCDTSGNLGAITSNTAGFVLTSNGTSAPSFQAAGGGSTTAFYAYQNVSVTNALGNSTIYNAPFNSTTRNDGGNFSTSTGLFTAPSNGVYSFTTTINLANIVTSTEIVIAYKGSVQSQILVLVGAGAIGAFQNACINGAWVMTMIAGDTVGVQVFSNEATQTVTYDGDVIGSGALHGNSSFSGFRVGT